MRINKIIAKERCSQQILSANSLRECIEINMENLYLDIGTYKRVQGCALTEPGAPGT